MKISHKELRNIYQAYISGKTTPSKGSCLSIEALNKFFNAQVPIDRKSEIIDHITNCNYCAQKFIFLLEIKRGANLLDEELKKYFENNSAMQSDRKRFIRTNYSPKLLWNKAMLISGITISLICFLILNDRFFQISFKKNTLRNNNVQFSNRIFNIDKSHYNK